jgi:hypothetical protein
VLGGSEFEYVAPVPRRQNLGDYRYVVGQGGWTWAQTVALLTAVIAIAGAAITATLTYGLNQRAARRERQAREFAEAISAIEGYAEMPYRIRRRPGTPGTRHDLTEQISQVQSRIAFHQAWLRIEAPDVAGLYEDLVQAAKTQAGGQMKDAWQQPEATADALMSLGVAYPRGEINDARDRCIEAMRSALGRRPPARAVQVLAGRPATTVTRSNEGKARQ